MRQSAWLFSWIGETDHRCAESMPGAELGPIASAVTDLPAYDRIVLLTNYPHARSAAYCKWLEEKMLISTQN